MTTSTHPPVDRLNETLNQVSSFVWGLPLILLLVGTGIFFTIRLRGLQFRELKHSLWLALVKRKEEGAEGDISHYQALMTALRLGLLEAPDAPKF